MGEKTCELCIWYEAEQHSCQNHQAMDLIYFLDFPLHIEPEFGCRFWDSENKEAELC